MQILVSTALLLTVGMGQSTTDWEEVSTQVFIAEYSEPAKRIAKFYENVSFRVVFEPEGTVFDVRSRDGQWYSDFTYAGEPHSICVSRADGYFHIQESPDGWGVHQVRPGQGGSVPGDVGLMAYRLSGETYLQALERRPEEFTVFRDGPKYQLRFEVKAGERVGNAFWELDSERDWVCVRQHLKWLDSGVTHETNLRYEPPAEQGQLNRLKLIEGTSRGTEEDSTDRYVIEDFRTTPADADVFLLSTYGLSESLLAPSQRPSTLSGFFSPFVLVPVGVVLLLLAFRLRKG